MRDSCALSFDKANNQIGIHVFSQRIVIVAALVILITILHFGTEYSKSYQHVIFRESYLLPLILGGCWFGLKGALITSLSITVFYSSFIYHSWQGFSADDFTKIFELILLNIFAAVIGILRNRERMREKEKIEEISALVGCLAHEMNTPLFAAIGTVQLLQDEIEAENPIHNDLQTTLRNLKLIKKLVKQISGIKQVEMKAYVEDTLILDIDKSICHRHNNISL